MRKRQVAAHVRTCRPYEAAQVILDSGIDLDVGLEMLTERVIAHFQSRLRGEELAHASREWHTATTTGSFQWERAASLPGLLGSIIRTSRRREHEHRHRHIERHTVKVEPVTQIDFGAGSERDQVIHRHLAGFATADQMRSGYRQVLSKRRALLDVYFPTLTPTRVKDTQAAKAIKLSRQHDLSELATDILNYEGDAMLAAEVWPYLAGQEGETQRAVLEVFSSWSAEMCSDANRAMCYRDTDRDGPNKGKPQADIICPAAEAPELVPLRPAS